MILVVDNGGQFTHLIDRSLRDIGVDGRLVDNETPVEEVEDEADGVILSGGPSMDGSGRSREYARELDLPILGICLGHQAIALAHGGSVGPGEKGGYAEVELEILGNGLFDGLGDSTEVWASHADEVKEVPDGFEVTARSDVCDVEAMAHAEKPIYGVQFHPEVHHTAEGERILKNFASICGEA